MKKQYGTQTFPFGLGEGSNKAPEIRMVHSIIEPTANAISYNAKKLVVFTAKLGSKGEYCFAASDADFFAGGIDEILEVGVACNVTGGAGLSFNGMGMKALAGQAASRNQRIIIGSRNPSGEWAIGCGFPRMNTGRHWIREEVTDEWLPIFKKVFGKLLDGFTVINAFPFERSKNPNAGNLLRPQVGNMAMLVGDGFFDKVRVSYSEHVLDIDSETEMKRSLEALWDSEQGSTRHEIRPFSDYTKRLMTLDQPLRYSPKGFSFESELFSANDIDAVVEVYPFEGQLVGNDENSKKTKHHSDFVNVRNATTSLGSEIKAGKAAAISRQPFHGIFLSVPCVPLLSKNKVPGLERFLTNAVYSHFLTESHMQRLGLSYRCMKYGKNGKRPFCIVKVKITRIGNIKFNDSDELAPFDSMEFLIAAKQTPLFTLDEGLCNSIINAALDAAEELVTEEDREYIETLFPVETFDRIPLGGCSNNSTPLRHERSIFVHDLKNGCKLLEEELHLGGSLLLAVVDVATRKAVSSAAMSWGRSRFELPFCSIRDGRAAIDLLSAENKQAYDALSASFGYSEENPMPVVSCRLPNKVEQIHEDPTDPSKTTWQQINPQTYAFDGTCRPNRSVEITTGGKNIKIGYLAEIPKRPGGGGGSRGCNGSSGNNDNKKSIERYRPRDENILCTFDTKLRMLFLNQHHEWVRKFYIGNFDGEPKYVKILQDIFETFDAVANALYETSKKVASWHAGLPTDMEDMPAYEDNNFDFPINELLQGMIANDPVIRAKLSEVETMMNKHAAKHAALVE